MISKSCWMLGGLLAFLACVVLVFWEPSDKAEYSICFFRHVTQIPCPGCGLTRGVSALLRADFWEACRNHPLSPLFVIEAFLLWIAWGLIAIGKLPSPASETVNRLLILQAGLLLAVWTYRMVGKDLISLVG